jgi:ribosomal protein L22
MELASLVISIVNIFVAVAILFELNDQKISAKESYNACSHIANRAYESASKCEKILLEAERRRIADEKENEKFMKDQLELERSRMAKSAEQPKEISSKSETEKLKEELYKKSESFKTRQAATGRNGLY